MKILIIFMTLPVDASHFDYNDVDDDDGDDDDVDDDDVDDKKWGRRL